MRSIAAVLLLLSILVSCNEKETIRFQVHAADHGFYDCPVRINLAALFDEIPEGIRLSEVSESGTREILFQYDMDSPEPAIWFVMEGELNPGETRQFMIRGTRKNRSGSVYDIKIGQDSDELVVIQGSEEILRYRKSEKMPPEGVDRIFRRSAYIHPLFSPGGEVLTRIQPPDHYHHYGIWNPWTKTHINGKEIDYWNLGKGQGTVRTMDVLTSSSGPVYGAFTALQEHIAFDIGGFDSLVTMDEFWDVRYWEKKNGRYLLDLTSTFRNVIRDTILFDAYRYGGGIGFRATEKWNNETCTVLTSEGNDRADADGTRARWCIVEGVSSVDEGRSGILFLSHPDNREHPEPMRVWPPDSNGGQLFFEFCPIRHNDWLIIPGVDNILKYRMVVFDGSMTREEAELYWNSFAYQPEAGSQSEYRTASLSHRLTVSPSH
ncbi:MAG: PmoA family protein [Bacteroidales bacterium]|nr:PmoA family protein [Bacteroidales bacterium]